MVGSIYHVNYILHVLRNYVFEMVSNAKTLPYISGVVIDNVSYFIMLPKYSTC